MPFFKNWEHIVLHLSVGLLCKCECWVLSRFTEFQFENIKKLNIWTWGFSFLQIQRITDATIVLLSYLTWNHICFSRNLEEKRNYHHWEAMISYRNIEDSGVGVGWRIMWKNIYEKYQRKKDLPSSCSL